MTEVLFIFVIIIKKHIFLRKSIIFVMYMVPFRRAWSGQTTGCHKVNELIVYLYRSPLFLKHDEKNVISCRRAAYHDGRRRTTETVLLGTDAGGTYEGDEDGHSWHARTTPSQR